MTGPTTFETARLTTRVALASEIDELGHVNNAVYVSWVQDVGTAHWFACAPATMTARHHWVCLRHEIDYRVPVLEGEAVEVRTWLGAVSGPRFDRYVDVRRPGSKRFSCFAKTTWAMLETATGRPKRVGDDVLLAMGLDPVAQRAVS